MIDAIQDLIRTKLAAATGCEVTFDDVKISMLTGSVEVKGFTLRAVDRSPQLLTAASVVASISIKGALKGELILKSAVIDSPIVSLTRDANHEWNLPAKKSGPLAPSRSFEDSFRSAMKKLNIDFVELKNATIRIDDQASGYRGEISGLAGTLARQDATFSLSAGIGTLNIPSFVESGSGKIELKITLPASAT